MIHNTEFLDRKWRHFVSDLKFSPQFQLTCSCCTGMRLYRDEIDNCQSFIRCTSRVGVQPGFLICSLLPSETGNRGQNRSPCWIPTLDVSRFSAGSHGIGHFERLNDVGCYSKSLEVKEIWRKHLNIVLSQLCLLDGLALLKFSTWYNNSKVPFEIPHKYLTRTLKDI